MNGSSFAPDSAHVKAGATVRFNNDDQIPHNVTGSVKDVVSGDIAPGKTWSYTFKQAGDYRYSCTYHPWMKGEVFVAAGK
jgi:plastocyanin